MSTTLWPLKMSLFHPENFQLGVVKALNAFMARSGCILSYDEVEDLA